MFLRRRLLLLDPEEAQRRKHLRARIIRRNRIKREVEQGLEPGLHRPGYEPNAKYRSSDDDDSPFIPTFGGNSDEQHVRSKDRYVAGTLRTSYRPVVREISPSTDSKPERRKHMRTEASADTVDSDSIVGGSTSEQSTATPQSHSIHEAASGPHSASSASLLLGSHHAAASRSPPVPAATKHLPSVSKAKTRWRDAFHQVVFDRHEEILSKDPNRKWRQERFGLLLFDKKQYERAAKHLTLAITLGASSSTCWRRLAQSHFHTWETTNDWDTLWNAKAAYEQAMNHFEIACNPFALFEYAKVLEVLGIYTGALSVCASILQTFPRFQQLRRVMIRFVMLQRYQIFSTGGSLDSEQGTSVSSLGTMQAIERESMLLKCIGYTKALLLDREIVEGELYACVLYMHARLNELLAVSTTSAGGGQAAAKLAQESSDHSFEELFKVAIARRIVIPANTMTWKTWKMKSDTYIALAGVFHDENEPIAAADALSRALDLLEVPLVRTTADTRVDTSAQSRSKLALYLALGRNYYQCNQMEKAIRSMEAVFEMNPYHEEARVSLAAWFPAKWKYRLELEDASQTQIARVIRGIWGRNRGLQRRHEVLRALERKFLENPYHPLHRRNVLRVLKAKYAPLFMAQDISARRIQACARRFLYYARIRWSLEDQRNRFLQQLKSKQQTRKYRYNRHVRKQLAQLLPEQFEGRFQQEDRAALFIQVPFAGVPRHFRGNRTRRAFQVRRDAHRSELKRYNDAVHCIQRFYHRHCRRRSSSDKLPPAELLYRAQLRISQAKERVARNLQQLYRRQWKNTTKSLLQASQENVERKILHCHTRATRIQRAWRQHVAHREMGGPDHFDSAKVLLHQLRRGHERQQNIVVVDNDVELDRAARKIQALYRGKHIRRSLSKIRRVRAPVSTSPVAALIGVCETNHTDDIESCVTLRGVRTLEEKRALFDYPVVIVGPHVSSSLTSSNTVEVQHLVSAIEHNALLRCLVVASGDFHDDEHIQILLSSLKNSRSLRVLALGCIQTDSSSSSTEDLQSQTPEQDDELESPAPRRRGSHQSLETQSPMQTLSLVLRTANFVLEELILEDNALLRDPGDGACVAEFLGDFFFARYGRLRRLALAKMHFSDANAALLGPALALNTVLQYLDLHGNRISDPGAAAIATLGLACNRTLTYLSLAENAVGSAGARALFDCLAHHNRTVETLVLSNNHVLNDAIPAFAAAWQLNATLLHVDLRGNLVHHDHLHSLHSAVEERRASSSAEPELRLFLARKRFSDVSTAHTRAPLKSVSDSSSNAGRKGSHVAKSALSPTAFLRQARQSEVAMKTTTAFIRSPLAIYKQQQHEDYTNGNKKTSALTSVLALVSPTRMTSKKKPARHLEQAPTKLPAITNPHRRAAW